MRRAMIQKNVTRLKKIAGVVSTVSTVALLAVQLFDKKKRKKGIFNFGR